MCVYVCVYLSLSLSLYIHIYIYIQIYNMYICTKDIAPRFAPGAGGPLVGHRRPGLRRFRVQQCHDIFRLL